MAFGANSGKRGGSQSQLMVVLAVTVLRSESWHEVVHALSVITCARGASRCVPKRSGWLAGKRRRVAGLRREELATLAGISSAYYLRLEQGRATHPSAQVVDALARALRLDARCDAVSARPGRPGHRGYFRSRGSRPTRLPK